MNEGPSPSDSIKEYSNSSENDMKVYGPIGEQMLGCFFDIFWKLLFNKSACGEIIVSYGKQEIQVNTCFTPSEVWLSFGEADGAPGCGQQDNSFDITYVPNGFILVTKTSSPRRTIRWKAIG